jgi:hypothetical protein
VSAAGAAAGAQALNSIANSRTKAINTRLFILSSLEKI